MSEFAITRVTPGEGHHFFGYYDKSPWDRSGELLLAHRSPKFCREYGPGWPIEVGYFDQVYGGGFRSLAVTEAWNWQMGAQTRWIELDGESCVLANVLATAGPRSAARAATVVLDREGGVIAQVAQPTYTFSPSGAVMLQVDFSRLAVTHPTIGYPGMADPATLHRAPDGEGITARQLGTDQEWVVVELSVLAVENPSESMGDAIHWVSHLEVNPSGARVVFLHRWSDQPADELRWGHRLCTVGMDGTDLCVLEHSEPLGDSPQDAGLFDHERSAHQISHPTWRDDSHVMVWSPHQGEIGYHLYEDRRDRVDRFCAETLTENGHMSYSPDGRWLLTDTYPDSRGSRSLLLVDTQSEEIHRVADLADSELLSKHDRCDLHPRFHPSGDKVCVDSVHEQGRQMYEIDVSSLTAS